MLSHLRWKSRCAFRTWKQAGRPRSGVLYSERRMCKRDVQRHLNRRIERRRIQKRDEMFRENHPQHFHSGSTCKHVPEKQQESHYWSGSSNVHLGRPLWSVRKLASFFKLLPQGCGARKWFKEVENALKYLKYKRAGGPDNLSPEYLSAGPAFINWVTQWRI